MAHTDERRPHNPGQAAFKAILSEDVDWQRSGAFPPTVRLAVVVGDPTEPGPTIRLKVPHDVKLLPHLHPDNRVYTVIAGVFFIGSSEISTRLLTVES